MDLALGLAESLPSGLYTGAGIEAYMRRVLSDPDRSDDFRGLENELYLAATDLDTCERIVFSPIAPTPILAVAGSPASSPPVPIAAPALIPAPVAAPVPTPEPVSAAKPSHAPEPVAAAKPSHAPEPVAAAKPSHAPEPVAAAKPSHAPEPVAAAKPSHAPEPVAAAKPSHAPEPVASAKPSHPPEPVAAAKPSHPPEPVASAKPSHPPEPVAAAKPSHPPEPVASAKPSHPPEPVGAELFTTTQPGVAPPANAPPSAAPTDAPVGATAPSPAVAPHRVRGEDLIADSFEAMHDLHFVRDALEGGEFCLALAMEKLPCQAGIVHQYDIDRRQFLVTSTRGSGTSTLLLKRYAESDRILMPAARKRRAVVVWRPPGAKPTGSIDTRPSAVPEACSSLQCCCTVGSSAPSS